MTPTCFDALDRHVIAGHADRPALRAPDRDWTYAQLLEEVAAFGGVLRHCGVTPGDLVAVDVPPSTGAVIAVLACARIGAVHELGGRGGTVLVTTSARPFADSDAEVVLVRQVDGEPTALRDGRDYDWDVVMRAGRTDPAACVEGAAVTPYDTQTRVWVEPLVAGQVLDLRT